MTDIVYTTWTGNTCQQSTNDRIRYLITLHTSAIIVMTLAAQLIPAIVAGFAAMTINYVYDWE